MKEKRINEVKGVILFAVGLMLLASLIRFDRLDLSFYTSSPNYPPKNLLGIFGAHIGNIIVFLFGILSGFAVPVLIMILGVNFFKQEKPYLSIPRILGIFVLLLSLSSLIGMFQFSSEYFRVYYSGFLGVVSSNFVVSYFGRLGGFIIFVTFLILCMALVTDILISTFFLKLRDNLKYLFSPLLNFRFKPSSKPIVIKPTQEPKKKEGFLAAMAKPKTTPPEAPMPIAKEPVIRDSLVSKPVMRPKAKPEQSEPKSKVQEVKIGDYRLPTIDMLENPPALEARQIKDDLANNARVLEETLEDFGISAKVTDIERGPVITRYELEPAPGVKLNRIVALGDDIALTMKAQSVRIIAPIPGKGRVGVEVPNSQSSMVYLKEVLDSTEFKDTKSRIPLALGKDISGQAVVADLDDMPHILIAGTTGSGKTVCVNSLILSLLFKSSPMDLKFVMVDPKMVELAPFNGIPHLLCPVITESKKAHLALTWVVNEMEERYRLLAKIGARNIESYNEKQEKQENLPYIVVIIDEFADLMSVSRDQVETAVTRLAQLSRAVGIHLILATQRPSVDVITGVIKANLPARVSFKVASKVDSRTVLDTNGADKLLGKGDMLFMKPGESKLIRIQGALVTDKEIERVVNFVKAQGDPVFDEQILKEQPKNAAINGEKDELYDEAVRVIMESNQASVSILQRRMRLGYTRAARIIDVMELDGLVGPFEGSKPRKILVDRQEWLKKYMAVQETDK